MASMASDSCFRCNTAIKKNIRPLVKPPNGSGLTPQQHCDQIDLITPSQHGPLDSTSLCLPCSIRICTATRISTIGHVEQDAAAGDKQGRARDEKGTPGLHAHKRLHESESSSMPQHLDTPDHSREHQASADGAMQAPGQAFMTPSVIKARFPNYKPTMIELMRCVVKVMLQVQLKTDPANTHHQVSSRHSTYVHQLQAPTANSSLPARSRANATAGRSSSSSTAPSEDEVVQQLVSMVSGVMRAAAWVTPGSFNDGEADAANHYHRVHRAQWVYRKTAAVNGSEASVRQVYKLKAH